MSFVVLLNLMMQQHVILGCYRIKKKNYRCINSTDSCLIKTQKRVCAQRNVCQQSVLMKTFVLTKGVI